MERPLGWEPQYPPSQIWVLQRDDCLGHSSPKGVKGTAGMAARHPCALHPDRPHSGFKYVSRSMDEPEQSLSRRARKEAHVMGLEGTTLAEVSAIAALPGALLLVLRWAAMAWPARWTRRGAAARAAQQGLEWLALVPAQLAVQLDLVSAQALLLWLALALAALEVLRPGPGRRRREHARPGAQLELRCAVPHRGNRAGLLKCN